MSRSVRPSWQTGMVSGYVSESRGLPARVGVECASSARCTISPPRYSIRSLEMLVPLLTFALALVCLGECLTTPAKVSQRWFAAGVSGRRFSTTLQIAIWR